MDIRVFNGSGIDHKDRFNGKDYDFPSGQIVTIPAAAAAHIFGWNQRDRMPQIVRLGWAPTSADIATAVERLNAFEFEEVPPEDEDAVEHPANLAKATEVPKIDPAMSNVKDRTRSILSKAS